MNKHAKRKDREQKRAASKLASQTLQGNYQPPQREECIERISEIWQDTEPPLLLIARFWSKNNRLCEFAIEAISLESGQTVSRADIKHGHAHLHKVINNEDFGKSIHVARLDTINDLQPVLEHTITELTLLGVKLAKSEER